VDITETRVPPDATAAVTALYAEHALGLVRLAVVMTGDRGAAEDIVQEAFLGLYRRWDQLADTTAPLAYVRVSVVNGCRTALRRRSRLGLWAGPGAGDGPDEAVVLRYYLDLSIEEAAQAMGVSTGTVKSATHHALAAVGRTLKEGS
jgi:DNA-directed RNA polymerase specialized sigma24 family protein